MSKKMKESTAFAEAVYYVANGIYFGSRLPAVPKIKFRKFPKAKGKYYKMGEFAINGHYVLDDADTPETKAEKMEKIKNVVVHMQIHMCQQLVGKRPIHTKTFYNIKEQVDGFKLGLINLEDDNGEVVAEEAVEAVPAEAKAPVAADAAASTQ